MSSTFFGLTIAGSGLNAFQASIQTTANNVANVDTEGYSRQVVNKEASSALRVWQKYGSTSTGVFASGVTQMRNEYYDTKYWDNESDYGYFDKKNYYMMQIEDYFNDQGETVPGFSSIFGDMFNTLEQVQNAAGDSSYRTSFVSNAQKLVDYFNDTSQRLENLQISVNDELKSTVDQVNAIARKISLLNKQINVIEIEGGHANDLRDSRALLVDELSQIIHVEVDEQKVANSNHPDMYTGATTYKVKINGVKLVDNYEYNELSCVTRSDKHNQSDADGLYDIIWKDSKVKVNLLASNQSGSLKAMIEMRDGCDGINLQGVFGDESTSNKVVMLNPNQTTVDAMNLPPSGMIKVNNTEYHYNSFAAVYETQDITLKDEDGNEKKKYYDDNDPLYDLDDTGKPLHTQDEFGNDLYEMDAAGNIVYGSDGKPVKVEVPDMIRVPILYEDNNADPNKKISYNEKTGSPIFDLNGDGQQDVTGTPRIEKYVFSMRDAVPESRLNRLSGLTVTVGETIQTKGIPYYQSQMNQFSRIFSKKFNDVLNQGEDLNGDPGEAFFVAKSPKDDAVEYHFSAQRVNYNDGVTQNYQTRDDNNRLRYVTAVGPAAGEINGGKDKTAYSYYATDDNYYMMTAKTFAVNSTIKRNVSKFAATTNIKNGIDNNDLIDDLANLESKVKMFRSGTADKFLQCVYADITVDAQEAQVFTDNYKNIQLQITKQRESVSGVDEDEEAMDLVKFQNAYNLNSKIISTLAEMYDQLILRTGV